MKIAILGNGGREHALAVNISKSSRVKKLYCIPGNAGTNLIAENVKLDFYDFEKLEKFVKENDISLVIVGPEKPLVEGVVDFLTNKGIKVFGPNKVSAQLEGSKIFTKKICEKYEIPTAQFGVFNSIEAANKYLEKANKPIVIKADGLAAGKGVLIIQDLNEAKVELRSMIIEKKFGNSSTKVVIEEFLDGIELSCFVLTDGINYKVLPFAKDYKKIGEGDSGLNTGGMGAISPVPFLDDKFLSKIKSKIIIPTVNGIIKEKMPYNGFIFIGLIKVKDEPYVIEYNVRMGDPETEVVFPRLNNDMLELLDSMGTPKFNDIKLSITENHAATVILVSGGYPESYEKGKTITGLNDISNELIFHAGTIKKDNTFITNGGRVLAVTSTAKDFKKALKSSYSKIDKINFDRMNYRNDIGFDLL